MGIYIDAFHKLKESILDSDILILLAALLTLVFLFATQLLVKAIKKRTDAWKKDRNVEFSDFLWKAASKCYTLFVTMISVFPLLGMFGTVVGLLGLDLASGDMNNIKTNFFVALTSTAWGIIFSAIFKILHALMADNAEEQIETAKKLAEELGH